MEWWNEFLRYFDATGSTRRVVMMGCVLLGISSGVLGTFAVLRRQSLLGDAMAHAALPGVCLVFLLTGNKDSISLLIGALVTGLLGALAIVTITRKSRIKQDAAIGLVLSVFFGIGIILLTVIQKQGFASQAGLDKFLFGKAASLVKSDVYMMAIMCAVLLGLVVLFYKEFKIISFDPDFGASIGLPMRWLDYFLTMLIVITVMVGLQAVGIVLMVAMIILPAASARQWTDKLGLMLAVSAGIGAMAAVIGSVISTIATRLPTGPVMVLAASTLLFISLAVAPKRGFLPKWYRKHQNFQREQRENLLNTLYRLCEKNQSWELVFSRDTITREMHFRARFMRDLEKQGFLKRQNQGVTLTKAGLETARQILRKHRLWELYLTRQMDIAADHVHRDACDIEHVLSTETVEELERLLNSPDRDPHGKPIPS